MAVTRNSQKVWLRWDMCNGLSLTELSWLQHVTQQDQCFSCLIFRFLRSELRYLLQLISTFTMVVFLPWLLPQNLYKISDILYENKKICQLNQSGTYLKDLGCEDDWIILHYKVKLRT